MRILVLAPQLPDPPRQGAAIRNLQILLYLAGKHRVTLLTFAPEWPGEWSRLAALCEHVEVLPMPHRSTGDRLRTLLTSPLPDMAWRLHSREMQERIQEIAKQGFDATHIEGIEMAPYALSILHGATPSTQVPEIQTPASGYPKSKHPQAGTRNPLTYDAHNAEYLLQRRAFTTDLPHLRSLPKALYSLLQWLRLRRFERQVCLLSKHVIAVSGADVSALSRLAPGLHRRITLLPNGVDPIYWSRDAAYERRGVPTAGDVLVFDGTMDFRPNVDAVLWFAAEVWPLIKAERPGATFFIVGRDPTPVVRELGSTPGISVTGAVEDPRPWVAAASVYVVPMRMGGGVRLKVLQAMSMRCPIVLTPMGVEGIDVQHGREMLVARSPSDFARATLSLLSDPARGSSLGAAARDLAVERYAWQTLLPALDRIYPPET
ncbi:MAG: glycosyltransferase family 4 protein [Chloroflexota bacterium]|nr:glycosyltransferase family 4 protein [Chloroflexota bacterium]